MATFRCQVCSELLQEGTTRCPRCGKAVSAAPPPTPPPPGPVPPPAPSGGWDAPPPGFEARPAPESGTGAPFAPPSDASFAPPPPPPPGQPPAGGSWGAGGWTPPPAPTPSKGGRTGVVVAVSVVGGVLVLGILAILAVTLLGRSTDDQAIPDSYTPELEAEFIKGCTSTGGTGAQCQCALEEVERLYTIEEFVDLSQEMANGGELPFELQSAILQKCI